MQVFREWIWKGKNNVQNNNYNYSFFSQKKTTHFCSTLSILWLCTKATLWLYSEQHLQQRGWCWSGGGGGAWNLSLSLEGRHCPPRHQMSFLCFPDVTPITTGQLKSRGCGPTRARSSFPWSVLPWQGRRVGWVGGLGRKGLSSSPILLVTQGNTGSCCCCALRRWGGEGMKVDGWQRVDVNTYPPILSFSGGLGRV